MTPEELQHEALRSYKRALLTTWAVLIITNLTWALEWYWSK